MDGSEAKKDYKQARRPMGVYRIRNTRNGKVCVDWGAYSGSGAVRAGFASSSIIIFPHSCIFRSA